MNNQDGIKSLSQLSSILHARRKELDLNQKDMLMKIGMSQQHYQKVETTGEARLSTLLRIAEGLGLTLMLVPKEAIRINNPTNKVQPENSPWDARLSQLADDDND